jgi:RNA polymerase sigma factor (sigma-70 family)
VYHPQGVRGYLLNMGSAAMTQLIDRTAVTRAAASQDADARITRLYETEIGRLTALGHLLTGDQSAAEDLAQDVFIDLLEALRADAAYLQGPPWPWLRTAMVHHVAKRFRFNTRELGRLMRVYEERAVDESWSETTIDYERALAQLPPRMRAVVVLKYSEDMTREQIAEVLGCGFETVKTQLRRAKPRLAELMGIEFHDMDDEDADDRA